MLKKYIIFSNSNIIVGIIVISILTKIIVITIFSIIEQPYACVRTWVSVFVCACVCECRCNVSLFKVRVFLGAKHDLPFLIFVLSLIFPCCVFEQYTLNNTLAICRLHTNLFKLCTAFLIYLFIHLLTQLFCI